MKIDSVNQKKVKAYNLRDEVDIPLSITHIHTHRTHILTTQSFPSFLFSAVGVVSAHAAR